MRYGLLLFCGVVLSAADPVIDGLPVVAVTATWNDLVRQPAIALPDGRRLHLGMERLSAPAERGALVYLLGEGAGGKGRTSYDGGLPLGPLTLHQVGGPQQLAAAVKTMESQSNLATTLRLWTTRIAASTTTSWVVQLDERPLAVVRLTACTEPWLPWFPLVEINERRAELEMIPAPPAATGPKFGKMRNFGPAALLGPDAMPALPACDGFFPWLSLTGTVANYPALGLAILPQLDPTIATVAAWRSAGAIHLALPEPMEISGHLQEQVLARWWVDGLPVAPELRHLQYDQHGGLVDDISELVFSFAGSAPGFVAPPGAAISVEFLVVPMGWIAVDSDQLPQARTYPIRLGEVTHPGPQRSNRLSWTMP